MAYATRLDMIDRFSERDLELLTDRAGTVSSIDDRVLNTALEDATAKINGFLVKRYTLPFAEVPRMLISLCCDIAYYQLAGAQAGSTEFAQSRYDAAMGLLKKIEKGEASLGDETAEDSQPASPGAALIEGPARSFDRNSLKGF